MNKPVQHLGRVIGGVTDQPGAVESEAFERALDHALGCRHLGLPDRCRRFDIDDNRVVDIDQVIDRIGKERWPAMRRGPPRRRVRGAMNFGVTSVAAPNAASSRTARYSSTARPAASGGRPAVPSTRVRSLASAAIKLASMANP